MDGLKKLAFTWGDKVLLILFLGWALVEIALALSEMGGTPVVIDDAKAAIERVEASSPPPPEGKDYKLREAFDEERSWTLDAQELSRESLYFERRTVDKSEKQKAYAKLLGTHEHEFVLSPDGTGAKLCIFPGCREAVAEPDVLIGLPVDFKLVEATIMTVELSWNNPVDYIKSRLTHFILEKKKEGDKEWEAILDEEGEPLKIGLKFTQSQPMFEGDAPELLGVPPEMLKGAGPEGFFPGDFFPGEFGGEFEGAFGFPPEMMEPKKAAPKKRVAVKRPERSTTSSMRDEGDDSIVREETDFTYLDYNLDPNTTYMYRIKAYGLSLKDMAEIESEGWAKEVVARTKEDKNVRFTKYIPGLRNKKGELVKKADGSFVSPDKVYVSVSKLFDPPWSPQRYFIEYEHKGIIPGLEGSDGVGKEVSAFSLFTEAGHPVYIDRKDENFLYVHSEVSEEQVKAELDANKKNWKRYRVKQDFTLPWKVSVVREEVKEEKIVKDAFGPTGKKIEKVEVNKTYHYFLDMVNRVTKEKESVELERDNPQIRILKF